MRRTQIVTLTLLAAASLVGIAAGAAAAAKPDSTAREELRAAREAALASFKENRTAALAEYNATKHAVRESYLTGKADVIDGCRGEGSTAKPADMANATKEEKQAFAKCVRDGLKPLKTSARENLTAAREEFHAAMKAARGASLATWHAEGRAIAARQRGGDA